MKTLLGRINFNILIFMKYLSLIIFYFLFASTLFAQNDIVLCGSFKANKNIKIKIFEPINGYYNASFYSKFDSNNYVMSNKDSFYFKLKTTLPISLEMYITSIEDVFIAKSIIILFPKDSVHLFLNIIDENKDLISYTGSNQIGQKLLNDIDFNPVYKFQGVIDRLNLLKDKKENFISDIDKCVYNLTSKFDLLYKEVKITKQFSEYCKVVITQLLYDFVINKFLYNYKQREVFTKAERDKIINYFYIRQPVTNVFSKSAYNSYFYRLHYYNFLAYKKYNLQSIEPLYKKRDYIIHGKKYSIDMECYQFAFIEDKKIREDLWACFMLDLMRMGPPGVFDETITQFKEIFPNSKWSKVLDKQVTDIKQVATINYVLQSPIIYIDSTKANETLEIVLNNLPKNNPVFLDLWASWCAPCIKAFQYNKQLDTFLIANNIERLYISLDFQGSEQKWHSAIDKYALGGYHILANEKLITDIKQVCGIAKDGGISIPRYLLITKDKKIALNDAMTPANIHILLEEIEKYLLNK